MKNQRSPLLPCLSPEDIYGKVSDRAMFNAENLDAMGKAGIKYIVAFRLKSLSIEMKKLILESEDFSPTVVEDEFHWIKEFSYKQGRLVVSYISKRAKKDTADRAGLIEQLLKKVKDGMVKIKDIIPNYGTKNYLALHDKEAFID